MKFVIFHKQFFVCRSLENATDFFLTIFLFTLVCRLFSWMVSGSSTSSVTVVINYTFFLCSLPAIISSITNDNSSPVDAAKKIHSAFFAEKINNSVVAHMSVRRFFFHSFFRFLHAIIIKSLSYVKMVFI